MTCQAVLGMNEKGGCVSSMKIALQSFPLRVMSSNSFTLLLHTPENVILQIVERHFKLSTVIPFFGAAPCGLGNLSPRLLKADQEQA